MNRKKHKQAHTTVPRGKRVRVVLKDGSEFVDKFIERRPHDLVFEGRTVPARDIQSLTIYRVPPHLLRQCDGKIDYKSEETAAEAARRMEGKTGDKYDAYPCQLVAGHWHIGHAKPEPVTLTFEGMPTTEQLTEALKGTGVKPGEVLAKIERALKRKRR
jgi:hypothetical protein